jgi:hypothetical protein
MRKIFTHIALTFGIIIGLLFATLGTANATSYWGYNTCYGTGGVIQMAGGNGAMYAYGCGHSAYEGTVSSPYYFRVRQGNGSEVCYRPYYWVYPRSTWRAWTVPNC